MSRRRVSRRSLFNAVAGAVVAAVWSVSRIHQNCNAVKCSTRDFCFTSAKIWKKVSREVGFRNRYTLALGNDDIGVPVLMISRHSHHPLLRDYSKSPSCGTIVQFTLVFSLRVLG